MYPLPDVTPALSSRVAPASPLESMNFLNPSSLVNLLPNLINSRCASTRLPSNVSATCDTLTLDPIGNLPSSPKNV